MEDCLCRARTKTRNGAACDLFLLIICALIREFRWLTETEIGDSCGTKVEDWHLAAHYKYAIHHEGL